jgi:hypothetical protein
MKKRVSLSLIALLALCVIARAQNDSDELSTIRKSLRENLSQAMPGWTNRSIEPIEGSRNVLIEQYESGNIIVKIVVTQYPDEDKAAVGYKLFKSNLKTEEQAQNRGQGRTLHLIKEELHGVGDEGFVLDVRGSEAIAFRRGKLMVNISVPEPGDNKDVFFSRRFAQLVLKALKDWQKS